jgi:VIT1/CCC1 family predicted Fe2+/Mn2+ transporter
VPLLAYVVPGLAHGRFQVATATALITLFVVGASRSFFTARRPLRAGLEMLSIGAIAAGLAYLIGAVAGRLIGTVS